MSQALTGIKVIDFTRVLAGPFCTMLLADLGAEVIKIERTGVGDDSRYFGPFLKDESLYYNSINRNKRSVELNLKDSADLEILKNLIRDADVVVENFRPGTMEKLGIGYEELNKINEKLIYASCSGFGQTGPYSHKPAYDLIVQSLSGIMSITGQPGEKPTKVGSSIADIIAGIYTALGVMTALFHREKTGEGQMVDVSMLDSHVSILENALARFFATGDNPEPIGNRHPAIMPFTMLDTKDKYLVVAVGNQKLWNVFCEAIQLSDLQKDERFKDNRCRTENAEELESILNEKFKEKTTMEWIELLEEHEIPCAPVNQIEDVVNDPQVKARQMIEEVDHPLLGKIKIPGMPIKMSRTPGLVDRPAPYLGEHNNLYKK